MGELLESSNHISFFFFPLGVTENRHNKSLLDGQMDKWMDEVNQMP